MIAYHVTVGRIVHYYNLGDAQGRFPSEPQAAIVTHVFALDPDRENAKENSTPDVSLVVFYANERGGGQFYMPRVPFGAAGPKPGCWTWPPRSG